MKRRNFLQNVASATALAGLSASPSVSLSAAESDTMTEEQLTAEITAVLRETEAIWASQNTAAMLAQWDQDNDRPVYLAAEQENFFIGWDEIKNYLAPENAPKITEAIRVTFRDITVLPIAPDLAFATYQMRTDMKLVFQPKPFGSDNRATALFRKKSDGWKYVTYIESFQSASVYFQKLYEKDVADDYRDFYKEVTGKDGW
jgi:ketosteroid isomerase-like protein